MGERNKKKMEKFLEDDPKPLVCLVTFDLPADLPTDPRCQHPGIILQKKIIPKNGKEM